MEFKQDFINFNFEKKKNYAEATLTKFGKKNSIFYISKSLNFIIEKNL